VDQVYLDLALELEGEKPKGHFEKKISYTPEYFYVNSRIPSGMPSAFVVSRNEAMGKEDIF